MEQEGNGTVRYTVKELLVGLDQKLDKALAKLEHKAEIGDLEEVKRRVDALEDEAKISRVLANTRQRDRDKGLGRFQAYVVIFSGLASTAAFVLTILPHRYW